LSFGAQRKLLNQQPADLTSSRLRQACTVSSEITCT